MPEQIVSPFEQIVYLVEQLLHSSEQMVPRVAGHCPAFLWLKAMRVVAAFFTTNIMSHEKEPGHPSVICSVVLV